MCRWYLDTFSLTFRKVTAGLKYVSAWDRYNTTCHKGLTFVNTLVWSNANCLNILWKFYTYSLARGEQMVISRKLEQKRVKYVKIVVWKLKSRPENLIYQTHHHQILMWIYFSSQSNVITIFMMNNITI